MKKLFIAIFGALILASCGVGTYSVASGKADEASLSFTSPVKQALTVIVDGSEYKVDAVKTKDYKADRNIKQTSLNTIYLQPGQHDVKVIASGKEVFSKKLMISNSEHRIIEL